ncbi:MAG: hypothetical protein LLG24_07535, partial [Actinomycetia bacterium]|nr:hypothetical protein [Actinomycetes bacterium]
MATAPSPRSEGDILAEIAEIAEEWDALGRPNVFFEGFEPFAHPALPSLISAAADAGFARIGLETDGGALARPGNAAGALHAGVRHVKIRTLGLDRSADEICGRPGLSTSVLQGMHALSQAADDLGVVVAVSGVVPLCRHNVELLPATVAALA